MKNIEITDQQRIFLDALVKNGGAANPQRHHGLPNANRAQDKARQQLKRRGLVEFTSRHEWKITDAGRVALSKDPRP